MVEDPLRSFSRINWFRAKESVCMSRVKSTCSGCEVCVERARLPCFFRRKKSARRRRRETSARAPRAIPIFAPVESPEECLLVVDVGVDNIADEVELGVAVTREVEIGVGISEAELLRFVNCGVGAVDVMVNEDTDMNNDGSIVDVVSATAVVDCCVA
jgi:hypothetical protein